MGSAPTRVRLPYRVFGWWRKSNPDGSNPFLGCLDGEQQSLEPTQMGIFGLYAGRLRPSKSGGRSQPRFPPSLRPPPVKSPSHPIRLLRPDRSHACARPLYPCRGRSTSSSSRPARRHPRAARREVASGHGGVSRAARGAAAAAHGGPSRAAHGVVAGGRLGWPRWREEEEVGQAAATADGGGRGGRRPWRAEEAGAGECRGARRRRPRPAAGSGEGGGDRGGGFGGGRAARPAAGGRAQAVGGRAAWPVAEDRRRGPGARAEEEDKGEKKIKRKK